MLLPLGLNAKTQRRGAAEGQNFYRRFAKFSSIRRCDFKNTRECHFGLPAAKLGFARSFTPALGSVAVSLP
jgi:hypothetical protein